METRRNMAWTWGHGWIRDIPMGCSRVSRMGEEQGLTVTAVMSQSVRSSSGLPSQLLDSPVKSLDPLAGCPCPDLPIIPHSPNLLHAIHWLQNGTHMSHHHTNHITPSHQPIAPTPALNYSRRHHPHDACIDVVIWLHNVWPLIVRLSSFMPNNRLTDIFPSALISHPYHLVV